MKKVAAFCVCLAASAVCQTKPSFEVASIKPAKYVGGPLRVRGKIEPDGIDFMNVTVQNCILRAYGVKPYQVIAPDWIRKERYLIVAKAGGPAPQEKVLLMLQTLLADRFKLVLHRESREMQVYALVVAKGGPRLKASASDGVTEVGGGDGPGINFQNAGIGELISVLTEESGRPVFDETGLTGKYDFRLVASDGRRPQPSAEPGDAPSLFTAVQEQLGLKLEPRKAPIEILVVDRVERPTEN
jgi:uncharacterized protein (TIGR03435 family)